MTEPTPAERLAEQLFPALRASACLGSQYSIEFVQQSLRTEQGHLDLERQRKIAAALPIIQSALDEQARVSREHGREQERERITALAEAMCAEARQGRADAIDELEKFGYVCRAAGLSSLIDAANHPIALAAVALAEGEGSSNQPSQGT